MTTEELNEIQMRVTTPDYPGIEGLQLVTIRRKTVLSLLAVIEKVRAAATDDRWYGRCEFHYGTLTGECTCLWSRILDLLPKTK